MTGLKGNKGEWSEVFTFLNVLGKGRIYGAEGDVESIDDVILSVNKIIRDEENGTLEFIIDNEAGEVTVHNKDEIVATVSQEEIIEKSELVLDAISKSSGSFSIPPVEDFMQRIMCHRLKAPSQDKTDITMELYDPRVGFSFKQGFSIKSMLGSQSTLLNASKATNFIFRLTGDVTPEIIEKVNNREGDKRLAPRYKVLTDNDISIEFYGMESDTFYDNLELIDSELPAIVAEMLKLYYIRGINDIQKQTDILARENPLDFRNEKSPHYEYKIKKFLVACALGMVPNTSWEGREDANGGFLIVRKDRDVECHHIYNRNEFENYLINDTKLDTASTSRHGFSFIEELPDGNKILKLNLQIRFK